MKNYLLLLLIVFSISCNSKKDYASQQKQETGMQDSSVLKLDESTGKNYIFQLHLKGIQFDTLRLVSTYIPGRTKAFIIDGESTDGKNWKFSIPDSVYRIKNNYFLDPKHKGEESKIRHRFALFSVQDGDTLNYYGGFLPIDPTIKDIYANYLDTQIFENVPMLVTGTAEQFYGILYDHRLEIPLINNSDFKLRGLYPTFPYIEISNGNMIQTIIKQRVFNLLFTNF